MRRALRENGLTIAFGLMFVGALVAQAIAGHLSFNEDETTHGGEPVSLLRYVTSSAFGNAVMENWQSEYLQFTLFILLTVWLVQRGSPESKELDRAGGESDEEQQIGRHADERSPLWARVGGVRTRLYESSLVLLMGFLFAGSWAAQSVTGWTDFNARQEEHGEPATSWLGYLGEPEFWEATLQNWQSEFLAVGSMAIFAVYLRQRGSPESKPVGAGHEETAAEG